MSNVQIVEIEFDQIKSIWAERLWDHQYNFEPTSAMLFLGGYDGEISKKYTPKFFAAVENDEIVGVVSGHQTSQEHYRVRGLYVFEKARNRGLSKALLQRVLSEAMATEGCRLLWAAPRKSSLQTFLDLGFKIESDFTSEGFLYGPNCYVAMRF